MVRRESEEFMSPLAPLKRRLQEAELGVPSDSDRLGITLDVRWTPILPLQISNAVPSATLLKGVSEELPREPTTGDWLWWVPSIDHLCNPLPTDMRGLLDDFLELAHGGTDAVEGFVFKWGSLDMCPHGIPSHCQVVSEEILDTAGQPKEILWEPVGGYQRESARFQSLLEVAVAVSSGKPTPTDHWLRCLAPLSDETLQETMLEDYELARGPFESPIDHARLVDFFRELEEEDIALAHVLAETLQKDAVVLAFEWTPVSQAPSAQRRPRIVLTGTTMGVLAYQLATVVQGGAFAVCSNCHLSYPPRRKPQAGRDNFGARCVDARKAAYKRRQSAQRARQPENQEVKP
jgi:hypothetical protein